MDITEQGKSAGKAAMHAGAEAMDSAAMHARNVGHQVGGFVHRRPVETALLSAAAACLITGIAFWCTRPD